MTERLLLKPSIFTFTCMYSIHKSHYDKIVFLKPLLLFFAFLKILDRILFNLNPLRAYDNANNYK